MRSGPRAGRALAALALLAQLALTGGRARAAPAPTAADRSPGQDLSIYVVTFGPGDHPFFKFGHDALWIHDAAAGTDKVYNFGTFTFDSPRLIFDFLHGRLTYWLSVAYLPATLAAYERENRTVDVQELALPPAAKADLQARLDVNARPENRAYKYDYFLDNCATRVRDAVDRAVDGRLRDSAREPARLSLRGQALRMTADYLPLYVALDVVLGPEADRPIDRWAEMFIPEELARGLSAVTLPTAAGPLPLVAVAKTVFPAHRPPPRDRPPGWRGAFGLVGLGVGLLFWALGAGAARAAARRAPAPWIWRAAFGLLLAVWGLVAGFVGSFLVYAWAATDHVVAHDNQNILLFGPWALALAPLGLGVMFGSRRAARGATAITTLAMAAIVAAALLKLGLARPQENGRLLTFALPAWLGIAAALRTGLGIPGDPPPQEPAGRFRWRRLPKISLFRRRRPFKLGRLPLAHTLSRSGGSLAAFFQGSDFSYVRRLAVRLRLLDAVPRRPG